MRSAADMLGVSTICLTTEDGLWITCLRCEWSLGMSHIGFLSQYLLVVWFESPPPLSSIFLIYRTEIIITGNCDGSFELSSWCNLESSGRSLNEELSWSGWPEGMSVGDYLGCINWGGKNYLLWIAQFPSQEDLESDLIANMFAFLGLHFLNTGVM